MTLLGNGWILSSFCFTALSSVYWPVMPSWYWGLAFFCCVGVSVTYQRFNFLLGILLALTVVILHATAYQYHSRILFQSEGHLTINGEVNSSFKVNRYGYSGVISVTAINNSYLLPIFRPKVLLHAQYPFVDGSNFKAAITLKPIIGRLNEQGYDKEKSMFSQGVIAEAKLIDKQAWYVVERESLRHKLLALNQDMLLGLTHAPYLLALSFGERSLMTPQLWDALKFSGLAHLVSISGLHVGMVFFIGFVVGRLWLRLMPYPFFLPYLSGLMMALTYTWLAGFAIPTVRAFTFCLLATGFVVLRVATPLTNKLLLTLALHLVWAPFAALSMSFWLSYSATIIVIFLVHQNPMSSSDIRTQRLDGFVARGVKAVKKSAHYQVGLSFLLLPTTIYFFGGMSFSSLIYNLLFIPWFTVVVVPLVMATLMLSVLLPDVALKGWRLADWAIVPLDYSLRWADTTWLDLPNEFAFIVATLLCVYLLRRLVHAAVYSWGAFVALLAMLSFPKHRPDWTLTVFDVGHGLAVVIEHKNKHILYDTGKGDAEFSMIQQVLVPVYRSRGVTQFDGMIISHYDNDHAGGFDDAVKWLQPEWIRSSQRQPHILPCVANQSWQVEALTFDVLWPPKRVSRAYNPHSCVVRVTHRQSGFRVLLTGDIERVAEWMLVREPARLSANVLVVPHHGSKTSSSERLVTVVNPEVAIASLAKGGRWNLPDASVKQRYQNLGALWLDTGHQGQVTVEMTGKNWRIKTQRRLGLQPWYRQMLRKRVE